MPSLLGDDPRVIPTQANTHRVTPQNVSNTLAGGAAGLLGIPADILQLMASGVNAGFRPGTQGPQIPLTSDKIAGLLGADPSGIDTQIGLIGAPDPKDILKLGAIGGKGLLDAMTLFHGTPHRFEKFDLGAIGTGEGAQAFGHGLYFAENKGVAQSYKNNLTPDQMKKVNNNLSVIGLGGHGQSLNLAQELVDNGGDLQKANLQLRRVAKGLASDGDAKGAESVGIFADTVQSKIDSGITKMNIQKGHLYEAEIPDEVTGKMLDWDAPLSEQDLSKFSESSGIDIRPVTLGNGEKGLTIVGQDGSGTVIARGDTGQDYYRALASRLGGDEAASKALNEAGIPGIRFFDGSSRSAGEGTRNIVVFNPDDITQVKRDGDLVFENKLGIK